MACTCVHTFDSWTTFGGRTRGDLNMLSQNVHRATTACTFSHLNFQKCSGPWCALYIFTSKCASRHNGIHFFDISTSKSAPRMVCFAHVHFQMCFAPQQRARLNISASNSAPAMVCFVHFDLNMCFTPQWRALFRHLNFQKCSEYGVF